MRPDVAQAGTLRARWGPRGGCLAAHPAAHTSRLLSNAAFAPMQEGIDDESYKYVFEPVMQKVRAVGLKERKITPAGVGKGSHRGFGAADGGTPVATALWG